MSDISLIAAGGLAKTAQSEPVKDGTAAKVEMMLEYRRLASQLRRRAASLTEQHPDQWVALASGGELFVADTMDELLAVLDEMDLRDGDVAIEFLDANPAPLII